MEINITIFVQIINFWITYGVLHRFFLKPMVAFIQQKEGAFAAHQSMLQHKDEVIQSLQKDKQTELTTFKDHLKNDYKTVEPAQHEREIPALAAAHIVGDTSTAIAQCKQTIMKKVCNVCSCSDF